MLPVAPQTFMYAVGIIEIIAGLLVLAAPRIGGYVVSVWLVGIAANLVMAGFYDIAVRDLVMAVGAFCLARLAEPAVARAPVRRKRGMEPITAPA
jgi:hypothetical protein